MCEEKSTELQSVQGTDIQNVDQLERSVQRAENYIKFLDRIRKYSISMTNIYDWVDQQGVPYLTIFGCQKLAIGFGITIEDVQGRQETMSDSIGDIIEYVYEGFGSWNNKTLHAIGSCNSRDKFFARRKNQENGQEYFLPLSEISIPNLRKKAHTNFLNRLIKGLLGLNFTWEEIEKYSNGRITQKNVRQITYDKGKHGGKPVTDKPAIVKLRSQLRSMILELHNNNKTNARKYLQKMTTFTTNDGKEIMGKETVDELSEQQILRVC